MQAWAVGLGYTSRLSTGKLLIVLMNRVVNPERIIWILGAGIALSLLGDATLYVVLPTHTGEAGILIGQVGIILSANRLIRLVLNGPYGVIVERSSRRKVLLASVLVGALATSLYTFKIFWLFVIGRLLWGAAWSGLYIGVNAVLYDIAGDGNRGRIIGRFQMWLFIGMGGSSVVGGLLTDLLGFREAMWAGVLALFGALALWYTLLPETQSDSAPEIASPSAAPSPAVGIFSAPVITAMLIMGLNWLVFLGWINGAMSIILEQRVSDSLEIAGVVIKIGTLTGVVVAFQMIAGLMTAPISGQLSDWSRNRWGLVMGALIAGVISLAALVNGRGWVVIAATLLASMTSGILQTQSITIVGDYAGRNRRALGVMATVSDAGSAAGPLIGFAILPIIGLDGVFVVATIITIAALPLVARMARREYRQPALASVSGS
jgi:MFS family permease